ncbi:Protein CBG26323 [Caenorhabditis briggsae]|uniref:BZIP domain-containing protein n=2 Tax=Caenorhabditis briggsae TaxID=6238 RepID=A0AAE9ABE7_CAEBR|nr:Protein CBG26323 [Caenorhabditis briggsae]ULT95351.1 hypothetical protein L3Y34_004226 [Caenorhabditis briggsae]UMM28558.1 hypothetical protein L5515_011344 [Caenorhabditis briggsae]CAR98925.1 Protein CBG26323 [Caenorhabditis briggsae]
MQPTTPLRHFPYKNENICIQKPIMVNGYKMMTNHNPFGATNHPHDQMPADFYYPRNNGSQCSPPSNYSNYESYGNNGGNYQQYTVSSPNYQNVKNEPEEEYVEDPIQQKITPKKKAVMISAPRKYKKKSELEKNDPAYIEVRSRNNRAVQLSREKKKRREEAEKEAFKKLKQKCSEMENLIKQFQEEVRASRCQIPFNVFPSLEKMINYQ